MLLKIKSSDFFSTRQYSYLVSRTVKTREFKLLCFLSVVREEMKEYNFYVDQSELVTRF